MRLIEFLAIAVLLAALVSCKKEGSAVLPSPIPQQPKEPDAEIPLTPMKYVDLSGRSVAYRGSLILDLNKDGHNDVFFYTQLTGDMIAKEDKVEFLAVSSQYCNLLVDTLTEQTPAFRSGETITVAQPTGYIWYNIVSSTLMRKVTGMRGPVRWEGNWKDAGHRFLPFQVRAVTGVYNGWIELEADPKAEMVRFYRYAISTQINAPVKAGY